jgi:hypothetical protein
MPLANIVLILIVAGVALWAINAYLPMAKSVKSILNVVVVVVICVWLLQIFGVLDSIKNIRVS